ncbi:MAG: UPF0280 family protein [Phycisphaerae bacterium]|nr:UPF0280 family protein [Phycisphaerae bacterium]
MATQRIYQTFTYREAVFRICCARYDAVTREIVRQRHVLEAYIEYHPEFQKALMPIELLPDAPEVAQQMARAARLVGVGPMAAVAGAMAQCAARAGLEAGAPEAIIENGGDIYVQTVTPVVIGLGPGTHKLTGQLAFSLQPHETPISICSSSGRMGHSMSLGQCDLATVVAPDAALADAAATQAANGVKTEKDINPTLERIAAIPGVHGVLIVKNDRIGLAGALPSLVRIE